MPADEAANPLLPGDVFRLLVESVRDYAIFMLDPQGRIASWNAGAKRIKGYESGEIIGRHFSTFYPPEDVAARKPERELEIAIQDGRIEDVGWRVRKDGSRFWATVVITAVRDASGQLVGFAKVTRDLTDTAYRQFVEATNSIVWTADARGRANADSPSWRAFTGQTREEWLGLQGWAVLHPDDTDVLRVAWPKAQVERTTFEAEFRMRRHDGVYVWMATRATPLLNADGSLREWFGVTFDISARKQAELEREQALERERAARLEAERSENRWTTTLRSIGDAVISTDTHGRVQFMNPIAESLTGWSLGEARGRPLVDMFNIVHEDTRRRVENPVDRVLREGAIVGLANHTALIRRDGTDLPIADSAAPIRDASGQLQGVVLVFRDVSVENRVAARAAYLARAGEALASTSDYRDALTTVVQLAVPRLADWCAVDILEPGAAASQQIAVAHVDPAKVVFARELGLKYPPDPAAPTGVPNVLRTGRPELYPEIPTEMLERGAVDAEHLRIIRELQLRSAMVVPLRGRERIFGALSFVYAESGRHYTADDLLFAEDLARRAALVIERRKLEEDVARLLDRERLARAEAEQANSAKDSFLATVSHELRTPLNAILGWAVNARRKQPGGELDKHLAVIERNARTQAKLIEDVLDVSRIISGKLRLELSSSDVGEAVRNAVESIRPVAEGKKVSIKTTIAPDAGIITADADRLQQIVTNLLSNAVKFTPTGGTVAVSARREGKKILLVVQDTGVGIEPSALDSIFEPFRQEDSSTTRRHGGLGLGLAIVRQLVRAHGGNVSAESKGRGQGAKFVVELPAERTMPLRGASSGPGSQVRLDGLRVLVLEDEPDSLELLREVLQGAGAAVDASPSAAEALDRFAAQRPDLIVSDIGMPGMDGYAFLERIRAQPAPEGRTPAVALTAYARGEDVDRAFAAGFQMHLTKPVDPDHLVAVVANLAGIGGAKSG